MVDDTASGTTFAEHIGQISSDSMILSCNKIHCNLRSLRNMYNICDIYLRNSLLMAGKSHWGHTAKSSSTICRPCRDKVMGKK